MRFSILTPALLATCALAQYPSGGAPGGGHGHPGGHGGPGAGGPGEGGPGEGGPGGEPPYLPSSTLTTSSAIVYYTPTPSPTALTTSAPVHDDEGPPHGKGSVQILSYYDCTTTDTSSVTGTVVDVLTCEYLLYSEECLTKATFEMFPKSQISKLTCNSDVL